MISRAKKPFFIACLFLTAALRAQEVLETDCVCGNGIQEVLPQSVAACPYKLYGVAHNSPFGPTSTASLYYFNTFDGTGSSLGTVTTINNPTPMVGITAMDFSPQGVLYAAGRVGSNWGLATINCETAEASLIGTFSIGSGAAITAINFDAQGRLYAHRTAQSSSVRQDGILGTFNIATGAFTPVDPLGNAGNTFIAATGNGIAFAPFPDGTLFHAGSSQPADNIPTTRSLNILNKTTGLGALLTGTAFFPPTNNNPRINDMDYDPVTNIMYVSINDKPPGQGSANEGYLGAIDLITGDVNYIKVPALLAPEALQAVAVNRPYETCDQGVLPLKFGPFDEIPLPDGASCSVDCQLTESDCDDAIDNDFDGFIDCLDSDCEGLSCNGSNCTADTCTAGACVIGPPLDCDDFNDCTDDTCNQGACLNTIDETNICNSDFNPCTIDACDTFGFCQVVGNQLNGTACDDENFCTDDEETCIDGFCIGTPVLDGTTCDDGTACTDPDTCQEGSCIGERIPEDCLNGIDDNCDGCIDGIDCEEGLDPECAEPTAMEGECDDGIDNDLDTLIDCADIDCNTLPCADDGNPCTDGFCQFLSCNHVNNNANACSDENPCTDDACSAGSCLGTPDDTNLCDDGNLCSENDVCSSGSCLGGTEKFCDDENPCTDDFCSEGDCSFSPLTGDPCPADTNACTDDICNNGVCTHPNDNSNVCSDGLTCTMGDACSGGVCSGTPGVENCSNGIDDDCDFLIDNNDSNCTSNWLRVFVTQATFAANFGGATQADTLCQQAAVAASRTGTFKAFVSDSSSNAASRILNPYNRPWYLYTSTPAKIADNKTDLLDGTILQSIGANELGVNVGNPKFTWTGSQTDGTLESSTCNNWTSTASNKSGIRGATDKVDDKWVHQGNQGCNQSYRLYCFQIDTTP